MEFKFSINNILGEEISKIDNTLRPFRNNHASPTYRTQLCQVIDEMGLASAKAQGLSGAITGASRLSHSDHHLYIIKDENGSTGNGSVVGILKVGHKKLFIYEPHGQQHEMDPLCVLDFYVHESKQRLGCGKKLFESMLKEEGVKPVHLAIDRPSSKLANFLNRHYGLKAPIPQVNNFVIFEGFFHNRPESFNNRRRGKHPIIPHKHHSVTDWCQHPQDQVAGSKPIGESLSANTFNREAAGSSGNDPVWERRHGSTTLLVWDGPTDMEPRKEALRNINPREVRSGSPNERVGSAGKNTGPDSPGHRAMGAQNIMYSRHQEPPSTQAASTDTVRSSTPPMLQRDGPSQEYLALRNKGQCNNNYTDRRGHLVVADRSSPIKDITSHRSGDGRCDQAQIKAGSSWNVFGVPPSAKHSAASCGNMHTRFW